MIAFDSDQENNDNMETESNIRDHLDFATSETQQTAHNYTLRHL